METTFVRSFTIAVLLLLFSAWAGQGAEQSPKYRLHDLHALLGGDGSEAYAINNKGQVVGSAWRNSTNTAFLFRKGKIIEIGYDGASFRFINDPGVTVRQNPAPSLYHRGELMSDFSGTPLTQISGLNNNNDVLGWGNGQAFLFVNGTLTAMGSNLYTAHLVNPLNDRGQVATHVSSNYATYPAIADTNGITRLPKPPGWGPGYAHAINNSGHVVGRLVRGGGGRTVVHTFIYRDGDFTDIGSPDEFEETYPTAISEADVIVGILYRIRYLNARAYNSGFVWIKGVMYDPQPYIRGKKVYRIVALNDVNDSGVIVGAAEREGQRRAIMLTPVNKFARTKVRSQ